jgi:hypothetical protein
MENICLTPKLIMRHKVININMKFIKITLNIFMLRDNKHERAVKSKIMEIKTYLKIELLKNVGYSIPMDVAQ